MPVAAEPGEDSDAEQGVVCIAVGKSSLIKMTEAGQSNALLFFAKILKNLLPGIFY